MVIYEKVLHAKAKGLDKVKIEAFLNGQHYHIYCSKTTIEVYKEENFKRVARKLGVK